MARGQQDDFSSAEGISQISADLFAFATDREDVKWSLARLTAVSLGERTAVEYELGALKIIAVGWSITYLMGESPLKEQLQTDYWQSVHSLAGDLSRSAGMLIGRPIDYFEVLKQRFERYLEAMRECPCQTEPSQVVGPAFANNCGLPEDLHVAMAGSRLFKNSLLRVHEYLKVIGLC